MSLLHHVIPSIYLHEFLIAYIPSSTSMPQVVVVTETIILLGGFRVWDKSQTCPVFVMVVGANSTHLFFFILKKKTEILNFFELSS